jgi:hypothetical protein
MQAQDLERKAHGRMLVDLCPHCRALWFDAFESLQLTPGATLALFRAVDSAPVHAGGALPTRLPCPRCGIALLPTHDRQRTTPFTYYRCPRGHGRFTPFVQFLLEKDFIRPLAPAEMRRLRELLPAVRCSGCGAPVDLSRDAACAYCRAPVVALDPDAVAAKIRGLERAVDRQRTLGVDALAEAILQGHRGPAANLQGRPGPADAGDLVSAGLAALAALLRA